MFKGKRYTTIVRMQEVRNCLTGQVEQKSTTYGVYDNNTQMDVKIEGFRPRCYEEIKNKAIELNEKLSSNAV